MNEANAVVGNNARVLDIKEGEKIGTMLTVEEKLDNEVSLVEQRAGDVVVSSDKQYKEAAEFLVEIKNMQKKVTDYWEPLRASTYEAYNNVLARKKEMLSPLESTEKILKKKMSNYVDEREAERKRQEEEMRRLAQAEVDKKLAEAIEAEQNGDYVASEFAMAAAEVMDNVAVSGGIQSQKPTAKGISTSKSWEITNVDSSQVPINFNGVEIRPVDEKTIMKLIKASKGQIVIPGITYKEKSVISARR